MPNIAGDTGNALLGWSENKNSDNPEYQVGEIVEGNLTLYAIYKESSTLSDLTSMQQMTPEICANSSLGEEKQLVDTRDDKRYWVTKLADNNCWMTQNLDFDLIQSDIFTGMEIDIDPQHEPWSAYAQTVTTLNSSTWGNTNGRPHSFDPGDYYSDGDTSASSCNYLTTSNCAHFSKTPFEENGEHGHVGNYYNWTAAVAYGYWGTREISTSGQDIEISICPTGWRLPYGYNSQNGNDFVTLSTASEWATNSDQKLAQNPSYFIRAGYISSGSLIDAGSQGAFWSSTTAGNAYAAKMSFRSNQVTTVAIDNRGYGFTVRCIAR